MSRYLNQIASLVVAIVTISTSCSLPEGEANNAFTKQDAEEPSVVDDISTQATNLRAEQHPLHGQTLLADFDGDGHIDTALFQSQNGKAGIQIKHGQRAEELSLGLGTPFAELGDDLSWVDSWSIFRDSVAFEIVVANGEVLGDTLVRLAHPSILVQQEEAGGGLITYRNGEYQWIHQAD